MYFQETRARVLGEPNGEPELKYLDNIYSMTAWTDLVKRVYNENKHKPGYKLGNAMKDAAKMKRGNNTMSKSSVGKTKRRGRRRGTRRGGNLAELVGIKGGNPMPKSP